VELSSRKDLETAGPELAAVAAAGLAIAYASVEAPAAAIQLHQQMQ
jgi:hypothetical protein